VVRIYLTAVLFCVALAACADSNGIRTQNYVTNVDLPRHFQAASAAPVPLLVRGSPFKGDPNGDWVAGIMSAASWNPKMNFISVTSPGQGYYVVLAFGGRPVGGTNYCTDPNLPPGPPPAGAGGASAAFAAFCAGPSLLSEATAWTSRIDNDADPRIPIMMRDLLTALFPWNDPLYKRGSCLFPLAPCL
jgi:hypothetical protein